MPLAALSQDSKRFLQNRIHTPEALDIVFLLRSRPNQEWDSVDVAHVIGIEPISASEHLLHLYAEGVIEHPAEAGCLNSFQYVVGPEFKEQCLDEIEGVFSAARMEVIEFLIASQQQQMMHFSRAFRIGAVNKDG